ncbi:MAG: hypothetical protein AAFX03_12000 [Pseudomonadota bacterium]
MSDVDIEALVDKAVTTGGLSEDEARGVVNAVFADGIVTRAEADLLFDVNEVLDDAPQAWADRFVEAVKDFVLTREAPEGWVSEEECDWLLTRIGGVRTDLELDLLLAILRYAEGAPERLGAFALNAVCERIIAGGAVGAEDLERLRRALHGPSGEGAVWVTQREAAKLFELNDAIGFGDNDAGWNDLFARAIGNHLMALAHPSPTDEAEALRRENWLKSDSGGVGAFLSRMSSSLGSNSWFDNVAYDTKKAAAARFAAKQAASREAAEVDTEETAWLRKRLGWDKRTTPAERALIDFLKRETPGLADGIAAAA